MKTKKRTIQKNKRERACELCKDGVDRRQGNVDSSKLVRVKRRAVPLKQQEHSSMEVDERRRNY